MSELKPEAPADDAPKGLLVKLLDKVEWMGNKLPDPAVLFLGGMLLVWVLSWGLSNVDFNEVNPGTGKKIEVVNMMTFEKFAEFLATMVEEFVGFHPLGVVLVALLGVGVAECSGFLNACLKSLLNITPKQLLTPMLILVAIMSHTAADAGYVLVIPIGGVMFYAAGRHPLAGIAAAFAGVSGGFSANFIPSGIDPLLAGLTQAGVELVDKDLVVNPLCNIYFTALSSILIILVGWFLTDKIVEPRLRATKIDGDPEQMPKMAELSAAEVKGMWAGLVSILVGVALLTIWAWPQSSALRDPLGSLTSYRNKEINLGFELDDDDKTIINVNEKGAGAAAGLKNGDQVKKIKVKERSFKTRLDGLSNEQTVTFEVQRESESLSIQVTPNESGVGVEWNQDGKSIASVTEGGPAATAGLKTGDTIASLLIKDEVFPTQASILAKLPAGQPTVVIADRDGTEVAVALVPAAIPGAPLMRAIVPLIFLIFVLPGLVHGYVSGTFKSHRDVVKGMAKTMETMGYYLVLVFFAALFIAAFSQSNIGILMAVKGANAIKESGAPPWVTILGIVGLAAMVNLLIGSASAKWAMLAPIFVPMLMLTGISPEFTQAAYRVGDSTTNIITPMMPYFPLVVVFCQRYVKKTGIGTVAAMMIPFSFTFLITWSLFLLGYWILGIPLGIDAPYEYQLPAG